LNKFSTLNVGPALKFIACDTTRGSRFVGDFDSNADPKGRHCVDFEISLADRDEEAI